MAVTHWEHRSCIFASVALILSSLNSRQASFPVVVSFRNSLTVMFYWTSLLSESLDALMAGEIREKDMEPFWNTLLRVESTGRTPFKIFRTPMKSGFFNFLRRPIAVGLDSLFWYHRKVWRRAGKFWHTLSTDLSGDSHLVLQAFCTFVASFDADAILAHAKAWDLVLWKCPRRSTTLRSPRSASRGSQWGSGFYG